MSGPDIRRGCQHHRETTDNPQPHFHAIARFQKRCKPRF
jgi:hypothetical protein